MMIKTGRVEEGKTPSMISGEPSEMIKKGEAITKDESTVEIKSLQDLDLPMDDEEETTQGI